MSSIKDYEKIINFIYHHPEIPDDIRNHIRQWMCRHQDDQGLEKVMHDLWDEHFGQRQGHVNPESLSRLLTRISEEQASADKRKKKTIWRKKILKYAAAVLLIISATASAILLLSKVESSQADANAKSETTLLTAKGSVGEYTLPDGTVVRLNGDTRVTFSPDNFGKDGKRRVAVEGEAYFDVTKDPSHPFIVSLSKMDVEVLGTSFEVRNYPYTSTEEVVLLRGSVKVDAGDKGTHLLVPDQRFVYDKKDDECTVENSDASNYCRWIEPKLKLENEPLGDLLITISRKYCIDLKISPSVNLDTRVSITLQNDDLDEILNILTFLTDIHWELSDSTLFIS